MELTDKDRDEVMVDAGVCVVDDGNTSSWRLDDPKTLQRERDERRLKVKEENYGSCDRRGYKRSCFVLFLFDCFVDEKHCHLPWAGQDIQRSISITFVISCFGYVATILVLEIYCHESPLH